MANQYPPGTVKWLKKHQKRNEKPEWWIFIGDGSRMPLKRFIYLNYVGDVPKGMVLRYKNGNPKRCILSNIELTTRGKVGLNNLSRDPAIYAKAKAFYQTERGKEVLKRKSENLIKSWEGNEGRRIQTSELMKKIKKGIPLNLTDRFIAYWIGQNKSLREELLNHPELLDLKRNQLKLRRLCQKEA